MVKPRLLSVVLVSVVVLVGALFPPYRTALAVDCSNLIRLGLNGHYSQSNFGTHADIEFSSPPQCNPLDTSAEVEDYYSGDSRYYIQVGYDNWGGTDGVNAYMQWTDQYLNGPYVREANVAQDGEVRKFEAIRDFTYSSVVWTGQFYSPDGTKYQIYAAKNMAYTKDRVIIRPFYLYSGDQLWGSSGDHALFDNFGWRDSNKVWHSHSATCENSPPISYYHISCTDGAAVSSFNTWDSRR